MSETPFDWNLIRSFLAVMDGGSLMAAARRLGSSQPTLGRHVAELERQLGCVLFERDGRSLVATPRAHDLAATARTMEMGALQIARRAAGAAQTAAGPVRISASQPVACFVLPPILARLRALHPDIQIELVSSNAVADLLRREADIAVRMRAPETSDLIARRIGEMTLGAYASRDYLQRRGTPRAPADLAKHDLIGNDRTREVQRGIAQSGLSLPESRFVLRTDDLIAYWQAVRCGLGIGFVADSLAASDPAVVPVLTMIAIPPIPVWLVVHRDLRHSARIRAVYDPLKAALQKLF